MNYICPVCGYSGMPYPPQDDNICSCCGTHFGYHDLRLSFDELRDRWIQRDSPWFSSAVQRPPGWDAKQQLNKLFLRGVVPSASMIRSSSFVLSNGWINLAAGRTRMLRRRKKKMVPRHMAPSVLSQFNPRSTHG